MPRIAPFCHTNTANSRLSTALPWQTKNILIIIKIPPKMRWISVFWHVLRGLFFQRKLLSFMVAVFQSPNCLLFKILCNVAIDCIYYPLFLLSGCFVSGFFECLFLHVSFLLYVFRCVFICFVISIIIHNVYFIGCYFRNLLTMCILCAIIAFVRRWIFWTLENMAIVLKVDFMLFERTKN